MVISAFSYPNLPRLRPAAQAFDFSLEPVEGTVAERVIAVVQEKTGTEVFVPLHSPSAAQSRSDPRRAWGRASRLNASPTAYGRPRYGGPARTWMICLLETVQALWVVCKRRCEAELRYYRAPEERLYEFEVVPSTSTG